MNATTENKTETFEPVTFQDVHEGDRVRFVTANNGFGSDGGDLWRTGTVIKVTAKTVTVEITGHNPLAEDVFRDGKSRKLGRTARLRQADWHHRCVSKAATDQPAAARTAADLPKGTRVKDAQGRTGTVNGVDVGRVTLPDHPNFGREYVGVSWDADEKCPWGDRSRPFVDELHIEQEDANARLDALADDVAKQNAEADQLLADIRAVGAEVDALETETAEWAARVDAVTTACADEAPFRPGERVVHADGRCFTFVGVNPEDSSRILVARPTDGRVVAWLRTDCRAENEGEIAARHGETVRLHRALCGDQEPRKRPDLRQLANPKKADPETIAEIHASRCTECKGAGCPNCGYKGAARTVCPAHRVVDKRGDRAAELGAIPACEPGVTYGAWSEGAGGFVYSGADCATDAANWAADELRQLAKDKDTDTIQILAICREHEEQPANGCEDCNTEDED